LPIINHEFEVYRLDQRKRKEDHPFVTLLFVCLNYLLFNFYLLQQYLKLFSEFNFINILKKLLKNHKKKFKKIQKKLKI